MISTSQNIACFYANINMSQEFERNYTMTESRFNLVFEGRVEPGHNQDDVRRKLAGLFDFNTDKQIDYFGGSAIVLGESMDRSTANAFKQALANDGICTHLLAIDGNPVGAEVKSRRQQQRRKNNERRARPRNGAIVPDRRLSQDRRS